MPPRKVAFSNVRRFGNMLGSSGYTRAYTHYYRGWMPNGQEGFLYTELNLATIEKYVSPERLAAYRSMARGNHWVAIQLYERNTELSEALYGVIQGLEVALRNAIHNRMSADVGRTDWYDIVGLRQTERDALDDAKRAILDRPATITPGKVVAELTFGFWTKLFSSTYEKTLWVKHLHRIIPIRVQRTQLHGRLTDLKTLRNRIAHHERIIGKRDLLQDYDNLLETIGWISPDIGSWVRSTNCFKDRAAKKIKKRPQTESAPSPAVIPT